MAHSDPILSTAPVTGIAETHQSTVACILRAAQQGLFSPAEAELLIDRVRAHPITPPLTVPVALSLSVDDSFPATVSGHASDTPSLNGPDRTV